MKTKYISSLLLIVSLFFVTIINAQINTAILDSAKEALNSINTASQNEKGIIDGAIKALNNTASQDDKNILNSAIDGLNDINANSQKEKSVIENAIDVLKEALKDAIDMYNKSNNNSKKKKKKDPARQERTDIQGQEAPQLPPLPVEDAVEDIGLDSIQDSPELPPLPIDPDEVLREPNASDISIQEDSENVKNLLEEAMHISSVHISYEVELVPQVLGISCWAAAAAMITAWKYEVLVDVVEIQTGVDFWEQFKDVLIIENVAELELWDLEIINTRIYTVKDFAALLEEGPLWVVKDLDDKHAVVISEMSGDATPDGTLLTIYDPWDEGVDDPQGLGLHTGSIYIKTFSEFVNPNSGKLENEFYIAY